MHAATSRTAYRIFLTWWKDADPDIPVLIAAKSLPSSPDLAACCVSAPGC